jgi:DNA-binding beta-propeller fold protein YncE
VLLATALSLALLAGLSIVAVVATGGDRYDEPAAGSEPVVIPDVLLLSAFDQRTGRTSLQALVPGEPRLRTVLESAGFPWFFDAVISTDGRQLVVRQVEEASGRQVGSVIALETETLAVQWRTPVMELASTVGTPAPGSGTVVQRRQLVLDSVAIAADRVYVAGHIWQARDPLTVVALDRVTGAEVARWRVDTGGRAPGFARLLVSPDGASLVVLVSTWDVAPSTQDNGGQEGPVFYARLRLPAGTLEASRVVEADPVTVPLWGRPTPDGHWLYGLVDRGAHRVSVSFFDLERGVLGPSLDLSVDEQGSDTPEAPYLHAVSPDGRRLYLLAPASGDLVVVDVEQQRIATRVTIETSAATTGDWPLDHVFATLRRLLAHQVAAKSSLVDGGLQLSPDGRRLYAVGFRREERALEMDGIWVIDTTSWRIVERWLPRMTVAGIALSQDGRFLYAPRLRAGETELAVIETSTGAEVFTLPVGTPHLISLADLYARAFGHAPASGTLPSRTAVDARPVAVLVVSAEPVTVLAGNPVTVEARFVDPMTGRPLQAGQHAVRYDPPDRVVATLAYRGTDTTVTIELEPVGSAVYRGQVVLFDPGPWTLWAVAERHDAFDSRADLREAVTVLPVFTGSDGRDYLLQVTTDPERPVARQRVTFRLAFVDAETGQPLPPDVTVEDGVPSGVFAPLASFFLGLHGGATTGRFEPVGHGTYEGRVTFWDAGTWLVEVDIRRADGHVVPMMVGTIEVSSE